MKETPVMNARISTLLKLLVGGLLVLLAADLQAQLIFKTQFSTVEGYTNGWIIGQPTTGVTKWANANAFFDQDIGNCNDGHSWWPLEDELHNIPDWPGGPWNILTATNCGAAGGGQMRIASDGNYGTNAHTYFFKMDFPTGKQLTGPITVTWDWQFHSTNEIPADYNVYTNKGSLPGFDTGFTFSDYQNRLMDGNDNWVYNELCTPFRLGGVQDARHNGIGLCGGSGDWNNYGPEFKDGKLLHMKLIAYVTNAPAEYMNSYDGFCQRDGETNWQTAFKEDVDFFDLYDQSEHIITASGMRRCAGEYDPTSGVSCLMLWLNGDQFPRWVTVSNIRVVGPNPVPAPVVNVTPAGVVTFTAGSWLEAADSLSGPWTTVAVQAPYQVPPGTGKKFYRANN
jgi:hypothetical protein